MDYLRYLSSRIDLWYRPRPLHVALEHSVLFSKMPAELILHISSFLSLDAASSFSLSCRSMYFALGTRYNQQTSLETNKSHRHSLLVLLEQDLPDHILCFRCDKLHSTRKAHLHFSSKLMKQTCTSVYDEGRLPHAPYLDFSSVLFQMATKRYRQGLEYSELVNRLSYPAWKGHPSNEFVAQGISSAKIVDGLVLFRQQMIYTIFKQAPIPLPGKIVCIICPHYIFSRTGNFGFRSSPLLRDRWTDPLDHKQWKGMIRCAFCFTEFRIDFKEYESSGTAVFVTVWKDFGPGVSRSDLRWQSHTSADRWPCKLPPASRESICAAYEGEDHVQHADFDFGALQVPWLEN